ncbi:hypothetical protein OYT88_14980 [Sporolactobacillus sp. CQH2019]|uniref:hypothetical protein n=1 Tax=Sporolactobacillus sp. CQH2019 TaxID=3023512 RepID=UPI002368A969|nr:hypothetical protein [Sporolactobacillus sp. CQH2019]MDD9149855.1 hypothetical protein [Sporolactobacillus sp. CQH2019]
MKQAAANAGDRLSLSGLQPEFAGASGVGGAGGGESLTQNVKNTFRQMASKESVNPQINYSKIEDVQGESGASVTGKLDSNLVRSYIRDIEAKTGRKLPQNQIDELKNALRNNQYIKKTPAETRKLRRDFNKIKNKLISEWETQTDQKWPTYSEDVISGKTGKIIRSKGDQYDAHHIIENTYGGDSTWWNIHPAKFPDEHQLGIHGKDSPATVLFKGDDKR